ncbi:MAG: glycosyltransferase [Rhodobacteraceae bacterium]|nr:glycosyltransferase [Paracoccaceae bacterium]
MRILLIHQNFPAQFVHLAPALIAAGHDVRVLTAETNQRSFDFPVYRYRTPQRSKAEGPGASYADAAMRGAVAARAAAALRREKGFVPDVVFGHGGWGETLFVRDVFPEARHLTYAEFFYRTSGADTDFDPEFSLPATDDTRIKVVARSAHLLQAAVVADAAVSPTHWQASTFPPEIRPKISVIHDGIDTARAAPDPSARLALPGTDIVLAPGDEVLSFVNRQLEPYRGYHIFMRALPAVLAARPAARVVIVGGDGQSYGPRLPEGQTWKAKFLKEVEGSIDPARVHFLGQVPYATYLSLIKVSRVHAYLTYPFVLGWSMLEAMAAGALVIGSDTPPVREVIRDGENGRLVGFFDVAGWSAALIAALADPRADDALRRAGRATVVEGYDLRTRALPRMMRFVTGGAA